MVDEFQDTNRPAVRASSTCSPGPRRQGAFFVGDELPVDLPLPSRRRGGLPRAAGAVAAAVLAPDAELPVDGPRCSRRSIASSRAGSATTSSRSPRRAASPIRSSARPSSCSSPTRRATRARRPTGAAPRPGHIAARVRQLVATRARRAPARSCSCSRPGTDAEHYEEELRKARAADLPRDGREATSASSRSSTSSPTCGSSTTATTTRRCVTVLASPLVGSSNDALVLLRAGGAQAAALPAVRARTAAAISPTRTGGFAGRSCSASSGWRGCEPALAGAALRADRRRPRLRPRRAGRSGTGGAGYANMRKLARLARSYEELRGRDIEGFVQLRP